MSNVKKGDVKVTSYGRTYEVLGGPYKGNNGEFMVTLNDEGIVELKSPKLLEGMDGFKRDEIY